MIEKLKEEWPQAIVWSVCMVCMTVAVSLGKARPETMEMFALYILGAVGRKVVGK